MAGAASAPTCPPRIIELIERFRQNLDTYKAPGYKEAQLRKEFLDPFFGELGWDMDNTQGFAEAYKEVIHEDAISISGTTRAPDYCFRIGGTRKYFVEAKKPSVNILEDQDAAYQLRRYGWSAKLPLSILTDFEHFLVFDTRVKPDPGDPPSKARVRNLTFEDYPRRWDIIAATFSKDSVLKGRFDVEAARREKRGTAEVDDAFLDEIESWREQLAANLKLRNQDLGQVELNYAVQATIDRIIFLRICEDRGIEPYGRLQGCIKGTEVYKRLMEIFDEADAKYNSGLFHFHPEPGRNSNVDVLTPRLTIDDKLLKGIITRLYYPDSPYEFSILPAEVLGQVYEQFLGSVIEVTEKRARVVPKPEVRNAGGVFYTPSYIVDRIVRSTVGEALEGKTIDEASELRIVDPACGSGSFLLGAYQFLLDWHREQYRKSPKRWKDRLVQVGEGAYALASGERSRILLNHIYGVDIDAQAVEVTKLSLLLMVLEKTPGEVLEKQLKLHHQRALPDLDSNIKCGNSLLDYKHLGQVLLDDETRRRVNPLDWKAEFTRVFKKGGFDVVLGNPPYIRVQTMKEWAPLEVELYKEHYKAASKGNYDIYVCFLERGLSLLSSKGRLGYILPHKFFNAKYGQSVRGLIAAGKHLASIIHFGDQQVFDNATTYTCLLFLDKAGSAKFDFIQVSDLSAWRLEGKATAGTIPATKVGAADWNFSVGEGSGLFDKLNAMPVKLGDVAARMSQGIRTSGNEVYVLDEVKAADNTLILKSAALGREVVVEAAATSLFLQGREIKPYEVLPSGKRVIVPYRLEKGRTALIPEEELKAKMPRTYDYLRENRAFLEGRESGKMKGPKWFGYVYPKNLEVMRSPKILVPDIADRAAFALDETGEYAFTSGYGITLKPETKESMKYILGLLNSALLDFYLKRVSTPMRGGFFRYFTQFIEQLPVRRINFAEPKDKAKHDRMVILVDRMMDLHKRHTAARMEQERTSLQRQIEATDAEINDIVFELYGLTEDEIQFVRVDVKPKAT